ncbi:MAG: ABC transporter ATP-binding protein [Pseudomonadota bacterium]
MPFIKLSNVSLEYPIYDTVSRSFTRSLTRGMQVGGKIKNDGSTKSSILALDNLNLTFVDGDRVALLGNNGAGKTSLLKLLSGFYEPTKGHIEKEGKLSVLLNLMAGMDVNQSGYDNILLCGMLHGLERKEILQKVEEIAEFSELGSYLYLPVRLYSQGMTLRLAFSICTSVNSEILLLDEWIGAGDADFIVKARERLSRMVFASSILVFATHHPDVARHLCNKAIYLEHGKLIAFGDIEEVMQHQNLDVLSHN